MYFPWKLMWKNHEINWKRNALIFYSTCCFNRYQPFGKTFFASFVIKKRKQWNENFFWFTHSVFSIMLGKRDSSRVKKHKNLFFHLNVLVVTIKANATDWAVNGGFYSKNLCCLLYVICFYMFSLLICCRTLLFFLFYFSIVSILLSSIFSHIISASNLLFPFIL